MRRLSFLFLVALLATASLAIDDPVDEAIDEFFNDVAKDYDYMGQSNSGSAVVMTLTVPLRPQDRCGPWNKWENATCWWPSTQWDQLPAACTFVPTKPRWPEFFKKFMESKAKERYDVLEAEFKKRGSPPLCGHCARSFKCRTRNITEQTSSECRVKQVMPMRAESCNDEKACAIPILDGGCPSPFFLKQEELPRLKEMMASGQIQQLVELLMSMQGDNRKLAENLEQLPWDLGNDRMKRQTPFNPANLEDNQGYPYDDDDENTFDDDDAQYGDDYDDDDDDEGLFGSGGRGGRGGGRGRGGRGGGGGGRGRRGGGGGRGGRGRGGHGGGRGRHGGGGGEDPCRHHHRGGPREFYGPPRPFGPHEQGPYDMELRNQFGFDNRDWNQFGPPNWGEFNGDDQFSMAGGWAEDDEFDRRHGGRGGGGGGRGGGGGGRGGGGGGRGGRGGGRGGGGGGRGGRGRGGRGGGYDPCDPHHRRGRWGPGGRGGGRHGGGRHGPGGEPMLLGGPPPATMHKPMLPDSINSEVMKLLANVFDGTTCASDGNQCWCCCGSFIPNLINGTCEDIHKILPGLDAAIAQLSDNPDDALNTAVQMDEENY